MTIRSGCRVWAVFVVCALGAVPGAASAQTKLSGIGDSISQGYDANCPSFFICGDQPAYAFGQGSNAPLPNSIYLRSHIPTVQFVSVSGAEMVGGTNNAAAQATNLCAQATLPDRVVLLLGGNDVCNRSSTSTMYSTTTFGNALGAALDTLAACLPPLAQVHVLSVPRVDYLYDAGVQARCTSKWCLAGLFGGTCTCALVTQGTSADRVAAGQQIDAYNQELANRVASANTAYQAAKQITFSTDWRGALPNTSVGTYAFQGSDLAQSDCFHPNYSSGQCKLACIGWTSWNGLDRTGCFSASTCAN